MMVWNVLWLAAVAAAAAMAGFCMGRLSMQQVESFTDETDSERLGRAHGVWEASAAGQWKVQVDAGTLGTDNESPWIRMTNHMVRESVLEKDSGGRMAVESRINPAGMADRAGSEIGEGFRSSEVRSWNESLESVRRGTSSRFLRTGRRISGGREQQTMQGLGRVVGSPVSGLVVSYKEGEHPAVQLSPLEDKLYAPANGKIIKIFPMGNAFLFRTEFGTELYIRAGDAKDDLLGRYFRSRVVQNEIVNKGKLLLEFDRMGLKSEGVSFAVTVSVENHTYGSNVTMTAKEQVRPGEEIMRVREKYFPERNVIER